ncbi:MAG: ABC transporter permease [Bacillota bacterium]|jgi:ABC-2 type transport system permease protein
MRSLLITWKDLRIAYRDRTGLLMLLAMPLILIAVLGAVFGSSFSDNPSIAAFSVAVVDQDQSQFSRALVEVLSGAELQELIVAEQMLEEEAVAALQQGQLGGALVIPQGFAGAIMGDGDVQLVVLRDPGREFEASVLQSIAQAFADQLTAARLTVQQALQAGQSVDPMQLGQQVAEQFSRAQIVLEQEQVVPGVQISSFQYYAFAMACMFLLFSGSTSLQSLAAEERMQTYWRTMATPTSRFSYLLGKAGGQVAVAFVQFCILAVGTRLFYGVIWGNWVATLTVGLVYALTVGGLAILVSSLVSSPAAAMSGWMIAVQIGTALGGGMVPLYVFPSFMQKVAMISPVYWGLRSFLAIGMGQPLPWAYVLPLFAIGAISISLGLLRLARKN